MVGDPVRLPNRRGSESRGGNPIGWCRRQRVLPPSLHHSQGYTSRHAGEGSMAVMGLKIGKDSTGSYDKK